MKFKVCGITKLDQLSQLDELGIDYAGLIFYGRSPRYILNKLRTEDVRKLDLTIKKTGVFVNASEEDILSQVELYGLDLVQLHGDETPSFCNHISHHVNVIKAFRITQKNEQNIDWMVKPYEEFCDFYLFDTNRKGAYGGTGEKFDWEILKRNKINKSFFLSGGIGIEDIDRIKNFNHDFFYAVDINSKVEVTEGIKDIGLVTAFMHELSIK
jgi:phosphoribosylanthranilate isomerase